ncbi:MAG: thioredoxin domain-containing protein [bacterium]
MKNPLFRLVTLFFIIIIILSGFMGFNKNAYARVEWEVLRQINLNDIPIDTAISLDGTTAYILCDKNILIYSIQDNQITDTIPLTGKFTQIAFFEEGERLFLTDRESKRLSIIQLSTIYNIEAGQSPIIGDKDAPVSVVAFFDYQCPYCARIYPVLEELLEKYPKDVNLIIKHFPLRMHHFAEHASLAALASSKQNKYERITRNFFDNYKDLNEENIKKYMEEAGLDMKKLDTDFNDPSLKNILNQDLNLGTRLKVRGVPTLFINGRPVKYRSLNALSNMVETELSKSK